MTAKKRNQKAETPVEVQPAPEKDAETGRFVTGNIGGGRPKGARNKLGEAFLQDMLADWEVHGVDTIQKVRLERPDVYLKTVASILPQQLNVKVSEWDDLTDEQLDQRIANLARALELEIGNGQAHGVPAQSPTGKPLN